MALGGDRMSDIMNKSIIAAEQLHKLAGPDPKRDRITGASIRKEILFAKEMLLIDFYNTLIKLMIKPLNRIIPISGL